MKTADAGAGAITTFGRLYKHAPVVDTIFDAGSPRLALTEGKVLALLPREAGLPNTVARRNTSRVQGGTPVDCILIPMDADRAGWALRTVMVVDDLRALTGPRSGSYRLPLHLDASARHLYDFSDVRWRELAYRTVLMEAGSTADLVDWIEREALLALWSQLYLPPFVRAAWERQHPELAQRGAGPHVPASA